MKYLFVFNPCAKRYSREAEETLVAAAARLLPAATIVVTRTVPQAGPPGGYTIAHFAAHGHDADCVVAVGGDGTINLVTAALVRSGLHRRVLLAVVPYGTGNNLVRSFGLERDGDKALLTIRQGQTVGLDVGVINEQYYFINASFGIFAAIVARRVTRSLAGYTYETLRHLGFTPWPTRLRYTDVAGRLVELPAQRYIVGALLNTSHYGAFMHMAPDAISDDGFFDVKLVRQAPRLTYPFLFTVLLTGQYELSRHTMTFRAARLEVMPEIPCRFETDGDVIPPQPCYRVAMAGRLRLIVPMWR